MSQRLHDASARYYRKSAPAQQPSHKWKRPMNAPSPKTFLVCHGAWSAGWAWKKMHPLMAAGGHRLVTPTYTGLGERAHLANPVDRSGNPYRGRPQRHQIRGPARHRAGRPQLWRHGRHRRRRPRAGPRHATDLYRRLRARLTASRCSISTRLARPRMQELTERRRAGGCRRTRRRRIRRPPTWNG